MRPNPQYDTRKHYAEGIQWHGYVYESVPKLAHHKRIMIVEDNIDYLIVSEYSHSGSWQSKCLPIGPLYRVNIIGLGRPTKERIQLLESAIDGMKQCNSV